MQLQEFWEKGNSVTNDAEYPDLIESFLNDAEFKNFRRNIYYNKRVETATTYEEGRRYIEILDSIWSEWKFDLEFFRKADQVGNPYVFDYGEYGWFSPKTLQYVMELGEIRRVSSYVEQAENIVEIGGGYGSLCRMISIFGKVKNYTIYDIPPVLKLIQKYLDNYDDVKGNIILEKSPVGNTKIFDFLISNNAFCELSPALQAEYMQWVVKNSKHGFMLYSPLGNMKFGDGLSISKLLYELPDGAICCPQFESSDKKAHWHEICIITW